MANVFFMGDMHIGHQGIVKFRKIDGVTDLWEYHDFLVEQWNSVVRNRDLVFVLGDFIFDPEYLYVADLLNGRKKLIMGNHDLEGCSLAQKQRLHDHVEEVAGAYPYHGWLLTHVPIHPAELYRWKNIHGHCHHGEDYGPNYLNMVPEVQGYAPRSLEDVRAQLNRKEQRNVAG